MQSKSGTMPEWLKRAFEYLKYGSLENLTSYLLRIDIRELLKDSCFYYCSGSDISPIMAFKNFIHSYIYCDIGWGSGNFYEMTSNYKHELMKNDFIEIQKFNIDRYFLKMTYYRIPPAYHCPDKFLAEFSIWKYNGKCYSVIFICWDDNYIWENLYVKNSIRPIAICNIKYESRGINLPKELSPDYWMGHCNENDYVLRDDKAKYYGQYGEGYVNIYKKK